MHYELALYDETLSNSVVQEATFLCVEHKVNLISLPISFLAKAQELLNGTEVVLAALIDPPFGFNPPEIHQNMIMAAIRRGAKVIELCVNVGLLNDDNFGELRKDLFATSQLCKKQQVEFRVVMDYKPLDTARFVAYTDFLHQNGQPQIISATGRYADDPVENIALSKYAMKVNGCNIIPASNMWQNRQLLAASECGFPIIRFISLGQLKRCII